MKSLRNKVILSAIVLVFAVIATIGSTYAWFTVSNVVTVNSFDVNVESSEALLMRVWDGESDTGLTYDTYGWTLNDFSNVLTVTDSSEYDTELATWLLSPVTCLTGEDQTGGVYSTDYSGFSLTGLRKPAGAFLTPDTSGTGRILGAGAAAENSATGGYIHLQFWLLKPSGANQNITMTFDVDDSEAGETWEEAIWIGTYDGTTSSIFSEDLDTTFTWANDTVPGYSSNTAALNSVEGAYAPTAAVGGTTVITTLGTANVPELLSVYIWAEGWDADTTNDIMGATFTIDLEFTLG
jgi:hypothetical protein